MVTMVMMMMILSVEQHSGWTGKVKGKRNQIKRNKGRSKSKMNNQKENKHNSELDLYRINSALVVRSQQTSQTKGNKRNNKRQGKGTYTKQLKAIGKKENMEKGRKMNRKTGTREAKKKRHKWQIVVVPVFLGYTFVRWGPYRFTMFDACSMAPSELVYADLTVPHMECPYPDCFTCFFSQRPK